MTHVNPGRHDRIMVRNLEFNRLTFVTNFTITINIFLIESVKNIYAGFTIH